MTDVTNSGCHEPRQARKFPTVIVGPTPLLRESLSRFLYGSNFEIVSLWSTMKELIHSEEPVDQNILTIIDACNNPGEVCHHIERFLRKHPLARIVVLANHSTPEDVSNILRSGSHGYFATIATRADFIKSLELVMCGQTIIPSETVPRDSQSAVNRRPGSSAAPCDCGGQPVDTLQIPQFSERESHILRCLTEGFSNKLIARECDIAEGTSKVHVKAILRKLKVSNRTQAAVWAHENRKVLWPETSAANRQVQPAQMPLQQVGSIKPIARSHSGTTILDRRTIHEMQSIKSLAANAVSS